jgi:Domain of unknown function (DUF397)
MHMSGVDGIGLTWRKASASGNGGSNCVEVAFSEEAVLVRNSRHSTGPMLSFTTREWAAFLDGARRGEFDGAGGRRTTSKEKARERRFPGHRFIRGLRC